MKIADKNIQKKPHVIGNGIFGGEIAISNYVHHTLIRIKKAKHIKILRHIKFRKYTKQSDRFDHKGIILVLHEYAL